MVQQKNNAQSTAKYAWYVQQKEINVHGSAEYVWCPQYILYVWQEKKPLLNG